MKDRLEKLAPGELTDEQRELYVRFTTGARVARDSAFSLVDNEGRLDGPPSIWLLSPRLGQALEQLGGTIRYALTLPARACEIATLMVAHHRRSRYELYAHTRAGRAAGLTEADLLALAEGRPPQLLTETEEAVYKVVAVMLAGRVLDDSTYWSAVDVLGRAQLFELVTLVGYYQMLATQLAVFDVHPPVGTP